MFGGLGIFFWRQIKIVCDKSQGKIFISQKGIFTRKEEVYNFSDIKEVLFKEWEEVRVVMDKDSGTPNRTLQHRFSLIKNNGEEIIISSGGKSARGILTFGGFFAGRRPKTKEEEIAEKVANFLNVPLNRGGNRNIFSQFTGGNQNPPVSTPPESGGSY